MAYTHQYNVSLQYEFGRDTMVEATYMGNKGRRLHNGALTATSHLGGLRGSESESHSLGWDAGSAAAAGVPYPYAGFSGYAGMALQPFPHVASVTWGPIYGVNTPLGESAYNSLQFSLTRRMSSGLAANMSYNYSKATANSETAFDETWEQTGGIQDIHNLAYEADTVTSFDRAHIFKGLAAWQLPFGVGRRYLSNGGVLDAIIGGWNLTTIFKYQSGIPLGISPNVNYSGWDGAVYANYDPNVDLSGTFDPKKFNPGVQNDPNNKYFNTAAFSNPTNHTLGNGKRRYERCVDGAMPTRTSGS